MEKILMVCLGNICRSPLAHGIMQQKANDTGIDVTVDSAGTAAYHEGEKPDSRSIKEAKRRGLDITNQRARQFSVDDFDTFDRIYAMDVSNFNNIIHLARNEEDRRKVKMILNEIYPNQNMSVPDPYYGGEDGFKDVYDMLDAACDKIIANYYE